MGLGCLDLLVDDRLQGLIVPSRVGSLAVHDEGRTLEHPVPDLFPQPQGRLGVDDADKDAVSIEPCEFLDPTRKPLDGLLPVLGILIETGLSVPALEIRGFEHQIAAPGLRAKK